MTINNYTVITILWNLMLLLVPFFLCRFLIKFWHSFQFKKLYQKLEAVLLGCIWLLFIPNSAYIITEVRQLLNFCPPNSINVCIENAWMIMFFFTYAAVGWSAYVYLLNQMKVLVCEIWGEIAAKIYILSIVPFISLGVLLGLINRWNSWEVFIYPALMISDIVKYFTIYIFFNNWLLFTIFLYLLYFGGNYLFEKKLTSDGN